jgi:hypothetical protein
MPIPDGKVVNCHFGGMLAFDQSSLVRPDQTMVKLRHVRQICDLHAVSCSISEKMVNIDSD